jgi:hypothetical protein
MQVQMPDGLATIFPHIEDGAKTRLRESITPGQFLGRR